MGDWVSWVGWMITVPVFAFAFCYACACSGAIVGDWIRIVFR